jgi:hypothetical protein
MWLTTTYGEIPSETVAVFAGYYVTDTASFGNRLAGLIECLDVVLKPLLPGLK